MTEKQIKRFFEDKGMLIVDVAKAMHEAFPTITAGSAEVMLRELLAGRRWYPRYAKWLADTYGVQIDRPKWMQSVRQRLAA